MRYLFLLLIIFYPSLLCAIEVISISKIEFKEGECNWNGVLYPCELDSNSLHNLLKMFNVYSLKDRLYNEKDSVFSSVTSDETFYYADRVIRIDKVNKINSEKCKYSENVNNIYLVSFYSYLVNVLDSISMWFRYDNHREIQYVYDLKKMESLCRTSDKIFYCFP